MERKRKANSLTDNNEDDSGGTGGGGALLDTDGDTKQMQIIPELIPHILSYCNDDTLKRCACASRSWYTMVKMILWNEVSELLLSREIGTGKYQNVSFDTKLFTSYAHLTHILFGLHNLQLYGLKLWNHSNLLVHI